MVTMKQPLHGVLAFGLTMVSGEAMAQDQPARDAQTQPQSLDAVDSGADDDIVVVGQKPRGSVLGNIEPELQLDRADVRALGVSNITELLAELAPQLTSGRGGQPLVLLEGHRISSMREIASIPAESIVRVDILPEEVALRYGYPANQKVLNIVLRKRFRAFVGENKDRFTTAGGAAKRELQGDFLSIRNGGRLNLTAQYIDITDLSEGQRGITNPDGSSTFRTLQPDQANLLLNGSYARPLGKSVTATLTGEMKTDRTRDLLGPSPYTVSGWDALTRVNNILDTHLGATVNIDGRKWTGTWTATYDHDEERSISVSPAVGNPADISNSNADVAATDFTANSTLARLPAGDLSLTARAGASNNSFSSTTRRASFSSSADLNRSVALGALNVDVPIFDSNKPLIGKLSVNGNFEAQTLSDFSSVRSYGFGANWRPSKTFGLILSYSDEQTAPTVQQLGNPQILTSNARIFDYQTGQTVLVDRITGGNAGLLRADARLWHLGLNLKPLSDPDMTLSFDLNRSSSDNVAAALPAATAAAELAFPTRFTRDPVTSALIAVDARPVNIAHRTSTNLRWGINFTKRLKTPQSQIDARRANYPRPPAGALPPGGGASGRGGGPGGGFGGMNRGGFRGGRINFSLYHTLRLVERATLAAGQPTLDLLNGGTIGNGAGLSRHEISADAGFAQAGIGGRLSVDWQSATRVTDPSGASSGNLHFGSLATVDFRLFADLAQIPGLAKNRPWVRGMRISMGVGNIFNQRQRVTDGTGATPLAYRPALLDPLGRTVTISIRKLFF